MGSILSHFEYDIFISYRHNDNRSGWVTDFVQNLENELRSTLKDSLTIYFDKNPHDGLLETHNVDKSLEGKLKCLIFIPIISQTYCDPKSFAWQHEFCAFNKLAKEDQFGTDIKLSNGNVTSRILPVKINDLDADDKTIIETEIAGVIRGVEFIFRSPGVNRPLTSKDDDAKEIVHTLFYRDQINKVANAIKEIILVIKNPTITSTSTSSNQKQSIPQKSKKKILFASLAALILLVAAYFLYSKFKLASQDSISMKSIAVMPFANLSSDKEQEYFSDGLTEDVITQLAKIKSLKVISRTSVMQYKEKPKPLKEVGKELGVSVILEGSVQRSGDQFRITAQLIRADTDEHLWAESYDRPMRDIFSVQREVATAIAAVLKTTLTGSEITQLDKLPTNSLTAYDYYLKGKYLMEKREKKEMAEAIEFLNKSVKEDSTFVIAIIALADAYVLSAVRGYDDARRMFPLGEKLINKALQLQPSSGPAIASRGHLLENKLNFKQAEIELRKSISIEPNQSNAYNWLGVLREHYGDREDAVRVFDAGIAYNPEWVVLKGNKLRCLIRLRRMQEALKLAMEIDDNDKPRAYSRLAYLCILAGMKKEAIAFAEKGNNQEILGRLRDGTQFIGSDLESAQQLEENKKNGEYVSNWYLGTSYYHGGQIDKAMECYDLAIESGDPAFAWVLNSVDSGRAEVRKKLKALIKY